MWIFYAAGSAFFAGLTTILAKCGIKKTNSNVATAVRTAVVLVFAWLMVWITGSGSQITSIGRRTFLMLILSGLATGASWLCYFHALQIGDINKVVPVDKSSTVLTIILAVIFLREEINWQKAIGVAAIAAGIFLMIEKKDVKSRSGKEKKGWFLYAFGSAFFASLTAILGKIGISGVDSNLGTAIRTSVVLLMAWVMVFAAKTQKQVKKIERRELIFICCSGLATGASWLCYYKALHDGLASVVVPIDKMSVLVTVLFSYFVFGERLTGKSVAGLLLLMAGTVTMAVF